jgi:lipopolysaccharide transport system permease protein
MPLPLNYYDSSGIWSWAKLVELWRFRELLYTFFSRDLTIRYRQVLIGVAWVLIQPALSMLIFVSLFGLLETRATADGSQYASDAAVVFLGVWCWQFFASALRDGTGVLVNYRHVITKVYFPRILLPMSSVLCALFDFVVGGLILVPILWITNCTVVWSQIWAIPILVAWLVLLCVACVAWLSSLNAAYRDVGYALPFLLQIGMYLSPAVYDASRIPERWSTLYQANPMASIITWFRWSLLGGPAPSAIATLAAIGVTVLLLISGLAWFERSERLMADRI